MVNLSDNSKAGNTEAVLEIMEDIDDDCDVHGVHFVKISDPAAAYHYGISSMPTLVYFKNKLPNVYEGPIIRSLYEQLLDAPFQGRFLMVRSH